MTVYSALGLANPEKYEPIGAFTEIPDEKALEQLLNDEVMNRASENGEDKLKESEKGGDQA